MPSSAACAASYSIAHRNGSSSGRAGRSAYGGAVSGGRAAVGSGIAGGPYGRRGSGRQRISARRVASPAVALRWTDDHCHLGWDAEDTPDLAVADELVAEARDAGVERMVTVGTDVERSEEG